MDERRYYIGERLLNRMIETFKSIVVVYHGAARLGFFGSRRMRQAADDADAAAEDLKREMRRQDGQE